MEQIEVSKTQTELGLGERFPRAEGGVKVGPGHIIREEGPEI